MGESGEETKGHKWTTERSETIVEVGVPYPRLVRRWNMEITIARFILAAGAVIGFLLEIAGTFHSHEPPTLNNLYRVLLYVLLAGMSWFLGVLRGAA
jgi:hypothetical protein